MEVEGKRNREVIKYEVTFNIKLVLKYLVIVNIYLWMRTTGIEMHFLKWKLFFR